MELIDIVRDRTLKKYLVFGFFIILLILILQKGFLLAVLIASSLVISYFIGTFQMAKSIGLELVTFTTIFAGVAFGPTAGAFVGLALIISHLIVGHFAASIYVLWVVPTYLVVGTLAGSVTGIDFATLGIYMTLGINVFNLVLTAVMFPQNLANYMPFSATNIVFNLILFSQIGPLMSGIVR